MRKTYVIDGARFSTLEEFYDEISRVLIPGVHWGKNLNAFDDILYGGFGTAEEGFVLRWENSQISRQRLGHPETVRELQAWLQNCHLSAPARESIPKDIDNARRQQGPTVFDWIVKIIESKGGVELQLR